MTEITDESLKVPSRNLLRLAALVALLACEGCGGLYSNACANLGSGNATVGSTQAALIHSTSIACVHPGLVKLPNNFLLASFECEGVDGVGVYTQQSTDEGASWSAPIAVFTPAPGYTVTGGLTNLSRLSDGTIRLAFDDYPAGTNLNQLTYMVGQAGSDGAVSWQAPKTVPYDEVTWPNGCWNGGPMVELPDGALLWPVYCIPAGTAYRSSMVLRSTDGGMTWTQITAANGVKDGRDYDESAVAVCACGAVVMIIRHTSNLADDLDGSYWQTESLDGGLTWSVATEVVNVGSVSRPALAVLPSGGLILMGRANLDGVTAATGFGTSWDCGRTFTAFSDLGVTGPGLGFDQYDAMSLLANGTVGVVTTHGTQYVNVDYRNLIPP